MIIKKRIITDTRFHSNNPVRQFSSNSIEASINARFLNAAGNPDSKEIALEYARKMAKSNEKEREVRVSLAVRLFRATGLTALTRR